MGLPSHEVFLEIGIPKFGINISASLISLEPAFPIGEAVLKAAVDSDVVAILTLTGKLNEANGTFQSERFSLVVEGSPRRPQALFVASSIMAMIGISGQMSLKIPEAKMAQTVAFPINLPIVCSRLEERQLAYRAMVIEEATEQRFLIPEECTGSDLGAIAFAYHAIVDKNFLWPNRQLYKRSIPATKEGRSEFARPTSLTFNSIPIARLVLDQMVQLGPADVLIEDAVVADQSILDELAVDDGHQVEVELRSLTGRARYDFLRPPRLSKEPWGVFLRTLIDAEDKLDNEIIELYDNLAAKTVSGLTNQEKVEITVSPELDEDGFDWEMEDSNQ